MNSEPLNEPITYPAITLTRTSTIMAGACCCDFCCRKAE
jgi:hypothetical protein